MGLTTLAWAGIVFISLWFFVFSSLVVGSLSGSWSRTAFLVFLGMMVLMTWTTAVYVPVRGEMVIAALRKGGKFHNQSEKQKVLLSRIRQYYIMYAVAQVVCAAGQWIGFYFEAIFSTDAATFIWAGVAFPGLLLAFAFFFVLLAFRKKDRRILRGKEDSSGDIKVGQMKIQ